jgi:hypothetical protein
MVARGESNSKGVVITRKLLILGSARRGRKATLPGRRYKIGTKIHSQPTFLQRQDENTRGRSMQQATQARYSLESVVSRVNVLENSRPWNFSICFVDVFKNSDTYNRTSSCNYYCMLSHRAPL